MKPGRVPLRASPKSVNCEMASSAPFVSTSERFILPASSSKMRRSAILSASQRASSSESCCPTPISAHSPGPICPLIFPSTDTLASLTHCTTARTCALIARSVLAAEGRRRLARVQRLEQRRQVVGVLLFLGEDLLHHPPRGGVVVPEEADDLHVRLDGDPLGDQ